MIADHTDPEFWAQFPTLNDGLRFMELPEVVAYPTGYYPSVSQQVADGCLAFAAEYAEKLGHGVWS